jgi:hypothetical protein
MSFQGLSRRGKRIAAVVVIGGSLAGFAFSSAYFSSTDTSDFTTLTAGTIVIGSTPATATWSGAYSNLLPGASATADVNVANTGTAGLVYAIAGTASVDTAGFDAALGLKVYDGLCSSLNFNTATPLNSATTFADLASTTDLVGDSAPYTQAGDVYLAAGTDADLCVRVTFVNSGTPQDALQGATADLSLDFNATQINAAGDDAP